MTATRLTEIDFRRQIVGPTGLATALGWLHVGFRPAMTTRGWRTPGTGELARGWPDLVLVRPRDGRLIFAELKSDSGHPSPDQDYVLDVLGTLVGPGSRIEVHTWRPADLERIAEVLR